LRDDHVLVLDFHVNVQPHLHDGRQDGVDGGWFRFEDGRVDDVVDLVERGDGRVE
jgi:hypothetical protein